MTRFVVDCGVVVRLARDAIEVRAEHELLAPTLLRSQTLSALHEAVHAGELEPDLALDVLARIWAMPIRLLGDAVLRRRAWQLADRLGWGGDLRRRVRRAHSAAGGRVRDSGPGTGAPRRRHRPHGDDRRAGDGV